MAKKKVKKSTALVPSKKGVEVVEAEVLLSVEQANQGPWTQFWDMHSGGGQKEKWSQIFIQAPEDEACIIFYNRFGHSPHRVTCTCCGEDYSVNESATLREATGYHRGCAYGKDGNGYIEQPDEKSYRAKYFMPFPEFLATRRFKEESRGEALLIFMDDIKPEERQGIVPKQGYVWQD